jgi:hypothetical protein
LARRKPPDPPARVSAEWKARAALFAIALLAYANSFSSGLVQDAQALLTLDDRIRALTAANLRLIFDKTYWWPKVADGLYRPVTTLSLLFNYAVLGNGQSATGYHMVNFLLHAGNVWLVYALARRVLQDARAAFLAAALWAVHPIATEAVTNIAGRADLLAAMAVLAGLLLYASLDDRQGWRARASAGALFVVATAGVFSKENAAVLLAIMVLWDLYRVTRPRAAAYAAVTASLALLWGARHAVLGAMPSPEVVYVDNPLRATGFLVARWTAVKVIAMDLGLLLWPAGLSSDRSYREIALAGPPDRARYGRGSPGRGHRAPPPRPRAVLRRRFLRNRHSSHVEPGHPHRLHHGRALPVPALRRVRHCARGAGVAGCLPQDRDHAARRRHPALRLAHVRAELCVAR